MALSNAEKVRQYRERQKQKKSEELSKPEVQAEIFQRPFFEVMHEIGYGNSDFGIALELAGFYCPLFDDDEGPEKYTVDEGAKDGFFPEGGRSLGRAEVMIASFLKAAEFLAAVVNEHKLEEIDKRIAEVQASDLSDPDVAKDAFERVAMLTRMKETLGKDTRVVLKQWRTDQ
ncbi:hypothetical protein [Marivivens aquimaris]|uniref:hypothetical protein n=1 Tax=Marivivens aquimaris TaxID=2774876 RepID=UPI00187E988A|nr:hypothetical protein [Marivivens aquimaris]